MGKGIGFIPEALFCAHIHIGCDYDDAKADLQKRDGHSSHSDTEIYEWAAELQNENADDAFLNISCMNIHGLNQEYFGSFSKKNTYKNEWSAEFRGRGILLCSNDHINVVGIYSTDDDVAVGVVLKTTLEDVAHDLQYDFEKKWDWYKARGLNWHKALEKNAEKELERIRKRCQKMADDVLAEINDLYPVTFRSSAWTMSSQRPVGTFKKKPKPVVVHG